MSAANDATAAQQAKTETVVEKSLLDQIVEEGRLARDPEARERGKNLVKEFVSQFLEGSMTLSRDSEAMINARIAQIDHLVSLQLNEVLHNPAFQKLEASWRGLKYLVSNSETGEMLIWFRNERIQTLTWGGNPFKPMTVGDDPLELSPRRSFP